MRLLREGSLFIPFDSRKFPYTPSYVSASGRTERYVFGKRDGLKKNQRFALVRVEYGGKQEIWITTTQTFVRKLACRRDCLLNYLRMQSDGALQRFSS